MKIVRKGSHYRGSGTPGFSGRTLSVCGLVTLLALGAVPALAGETAAPHWGYEGHEGPEHWAGLSAGFGLCGSGKEQSPLDLVDAVPIEFDEIERIVGGLQLDVNTLASVIDLVDNGHTIQVTGDAKVGLNIGGVVYQLAQFHFHAPSEHAIDGRIYPLEVHFVMTSADGSLAVVGELYEEGEHDPAWDPLVEALPQSPADERHLEDPEGLNIQDIKPIPDSFFAYEGSLTTPPCSEGVQWMVLSEPAQMSAGQLKAFDSVLHGNARPLQQRGARLLERVLHVPGIGIDSGH